MSYYLGTKKQCSDYKYRVANGMKLKGSISKQHALAVQSRVNPDVWAILKHDSYSSSVMELVQHLPDDFIESPN